MVIRKALALAAGALVAGTAFAAAKQSADVFEFIPQGGRTILAGILAGKPATDATRALVTSKRSAQEWRAWMQRDGAAIPAVKALDEKARSTLADYAAHNMPLAPARVPSSPTKANWEKALPPDGRDLTLEHCQSCHIITVVITQDRTRAAWLGTMNKPSHVGIKTTPAQREALADYLIVNAAIPIDDVPEELRAGGATY